MRSGWLRIFFATISCSFACGGDDGECSTSPTSISGVATSTGGDEMADATTEDGSTTTGAEDTTTDDDASSSSTTDAEEPDPSYPPVGPDGGCPNGASLMLPGASVCAPFCAGPDAACPDAASGTATPTCTPFEMADGSAAPCRDHDECPDDEACSVSGTCIAVAFWGCRLLCDAGAACPDPMICTTVGACGYPG
jgi:hypothetical protein